MKGKYVKCRNIEAIQESYLRRRLGTICRQRNLRTWRHPGLHAYARTRQLAEREGTESFSDEPTFRLQETEGSRRSDPYRAAVSSGCSFMYNFVAVHH